MINVKNHFLKGIGIVFLVRKFLKKFKDLLTFIYIFDNIGCKERPSEKGFQGKCNRRHWE